MTTATAKPKMKGLFKGFKYISQIFEEEKEDEIEIGLPTDVKHVAHIGWDGPAVESPSWMKEFSSSPGQHSAPLGPVGGEKGEPEIKWVSEDASTKRSNRREESTRDLPDVPRSTRDPAKVKQRRKESSEGGRHQRDPPDPNNPDPVKKSRRKKSRDCNGTSTRSRSKPIAAASAAAADPESDPISAAAATTA